MMVPDSKNDDRHCDFSWRCHLSNEGGRDMQSDGMGMRSLWINEGYWGFGERVVPCDDNDKRHCDFARCCCLYNNEGRGVKSGGAGTGG
jgi:hypothetical protein